MLDYSSSGDPTRPALLLLHAGGLSRREWDPFLDAWAAHFHVIAPTAPGHGSSPPVSRLALSDLAASVRELCEQLGIRRAHVLGSSMGGATALEVARDDPDRVDRLILYRTGFRFGPPMAEALARFASPENWRRWGLEQWLAREHAPQGGPGAWMRVVRSVAEMISTGAPRISAAELARFPRPVLIIGGDRDDLAPLDQAIEMYRAFPRASLWIVPAAGHVMGMETWRKQAFEQEVLRFLLRRSP